MNKKLEAAANDFTHKVGLKFLARKQYNVAVDSFIAGAEWALREAIEICFKYTRTDLISAPFNESARCGINIVKRELEQLISEEK